MGFESIDPTFLPPDLTKLPRTSKRLTQLLSQGSLTPANKAQKSWSLGFFSSPTLFKQTDDAPNTLSSIELAKTRVQAPNIFEPSARVTITGDRITLPASLAFRSIGYKSNAMCGMANLTIDFDEARGIISNDGKGRAIAPSSRPADHVNIPGMYCSGWVKRGPAGVIANTMEDAFATAEAIVIDWANKVPFLGGGDGWDVLKNEAEVRHKRTVDWGDWKKIDAAEKKRGQERGKVREKFTNIKEMLEVLD